MGDVDREGLMGQLSDMVEEVDAETIGDTLGDVQPETLLDILAETL